MIFVDRNSVPIPEFFSSEEYKVRIAELKRFYRSANRSQKRFVYYNLSYSLSLKLKDLFKGKCAYCETRFKIDESSSNNKDKTYYNGVDHFRPRNYSKGFEDYNSSLDHYWWLTYEWSNIYHCCLECNKNKSDWFPVDGKRAKLESNYNEIVKIEKNSLIDPCNDKVSGHFKFDLNTGVIQSETRRGEITIKLLGLNRKTLVSNRLIAISEENKIFNDNKLKISNKIFNYWDSIIEYTSKINFLAIRKQTILENFNKTNYKELKDFYEYKSKKNIPIFRKIKPQSSVKEAIKIPILRNIQLEKIELINYKCFNNLKINFLDNSNNTNQEPWLVFLGENGVGKSSVLKAIAIALMGQKNIDKLIKSKTLKPSRHLQYGKRVGHIKLYGKNGEFYDVKLTKNKIVSNIKNPTSYLIGYGSTRLLPKGNLEPETDVEHVKIKNLFDYSVALSDAKSWLLDVPTRMFDQVAISLKDLLLLDNNDTLRRNKQKNELYIKYAKGSNNRIDVSDLSDGYKTIFAITVDLIKTLSKDNLAFETAEGTVLIDEIGTHLHPRWKMEVVSRLRKTFPKLQFIATTHEPLCLRGLGENEVIVLKKDNNDEIIAINDLPNPSEFRVDQLLTSEYFGLNSTLDSKTEEEFEEYYSLIAKEDDELTPDEIKRRDDLSVTLPKKKHLGDDIRDELVYYVIDELLAKQVSDDGYSIIDKKIKKEALSKVASIWKHIAKNDTNL